jgi:hypothetical protein
MSASAGASPSARAAMAWRREHELEPVAAVRGEVEELVDRRPKRAALELAIQRLMVAPPVLGERRTVAARARQRVP